MRSGQRARPKRRQRRQRIVDSGGGGPVATAPGVPLVTAVAHTRPRCKRRQPFQPRRRRRRAATGARTEQRRARRAVPLARRRRRLRRRDAVPLALLRRRLARRRHARRGGGLLRLLPQPLVPLVALPAATPRCSPATLDANAAARLLGAMTLSLTATRSHMQRSRQGTTLLATPPPSTHLSSLK